MRIIIADHHEQPRLALGMLILEHPEFTLIGEAVDAQALLSMAGQEHVDLVLLDCDLPGIYFEDLIARLHALDHPPVIIVISTEFEHSCKALKAGADAFVSKTDEPGWLLETLQKYDSRVHKV
jgi:DNA-binding NarL/FixJ family response regulator